MVIATRDRRAELLATLARLARLAENPPVVVVDNGSSDGSAAAVRQAFPHVAVVALRRNLGGAARSVGVERLGTPYVAFCDDDSWWGDGALRRAATAFERHLSLGLVAARILVGDDRRPDPVSEAMARSPLGRRRDLPGPSVLGFVACGAVVRREAYRQAGGFDVRFGIGGEEALLAMDLAARGWDLVYCADVVAYHAPSPLRESATRRRVVARNDLWTAWLRRPLWVAAGHILRAATARDAAARRGLVDAVRGAPWVLADRRRLPAAVEGDLRRLRRR